jgi:hypothetical protein
MEGQLPDPRFFVSTKRQREVAAQCEEEEPQRITDKVYLGSRKSVVARRERLRELDIGHIVMCCDRAPDLPEEFEYYQVPVNNETRDSKDQHSKHAHGDDGDGHEYCSHGGGSCGDLHLMKWIVRPDADDTFLAEKLCAWIDSRPRAVLVHGYDGVSNSAAVAIAYVMWKQQMRLSDAIELVTSARPVVYLPEFLMRDLRVLDTRLCLARATGPGLKRIVPQRKV